MSSEPIILNMEPGGDNYSDKINMIRRILADVKTKKQAHYKNFTKYKTINTIFKSLINVLNALSVCSMVLTFTPVSNEIMILALSATSISGVLSAVSSSIDFENKEHSHNTSYLQYTDLSRDVAARLLKNGLSSADLDAMLSEVNNRVGLIEDNSLPISI